MALGVSLEGPGASLGALGRSWEILGWFGVAFWVHFGGIFGDLSDRRGARSQNCDFHEML